MAQLAVAETCQPVGFLLLPHQSLLIQQPSWKQEACRHEEMHQVVVDQRQEEECRAQVPLPARREGGPGQKFCVEVVFLSD